MLCDDDCGGKVVYLQPHKRSKTLFRPPCNPVAARMDSNTVYKKSYPKFNLVPRKPLPPSRKITKFGELNMNTVYNMTYQWTPPTRTQMFRPKPRLTISSSPMEMISNHMSSYSHPGIMKRTQSCKKNIKDNCKVMIPMATVTTTKSAYKSYSNKLLENVKSDTLRVKCKWPSNFKPTYETNYQTAYRYCPVKPIGNCRPRYEKCPILSKINSGTTYRVSYRPPGSFMRIN